VGYCGILYEKDGDGERMVDREAGRLGAGAVKGSVGEPGLASTYAVRGPVVETLIDEREGFRERIGGVNDRICPACGIDPRFGVRIEETNGAGSVRIWMLTGRLRVFGWSW
jgi:hypothetical protein